MKKNRFYNNKKRNQKWTESVQGRQIDFADKYTGGAVYSDKFDYLRPKPKKKKKHLTRENALKAARIAGAVIIGLALIFTGYTAMDVYILRHKMPALSDVQGAAGSISEAVLQTRGKYIDALSLDSGEILSSVTQQIIDGGYTSAAFDVKRADGSVAYKSALSNVDAYGAVSFPADDPAGSVAALDENNILAVGVVYCYLDNIAPEKNTGMAVLKEDGTLYKDTAGNTYLNPESDEAYNYIKDIINECYEAGITVFVLDGIDLPADSGADTAGGFEALSEKLYGDIGTGIKLLEAEHITITFDENTAESEVEEQLSTLGDLSGEDKIYFITGGYTGLKEILDENNILSYIISD